jgi:serine/threonine-protein kinase
VGSHPFFSPDGQWIGFFGGGHLQKVAISGGAPVRIAPADMPLGASWFGDFIVFGQDGGIMRVPATGGKPELVVPNQGEERLANPSLVQSGRFMLFTRARRDSVASMQWDDAEIVFEELSTHARRTAVRGGTDARWLEPNYLVYSRRSEILATALDPSTLEPRGTPVMLGDRCSAILRRAGWHARVRQRADQRPQSSRLDAHRPDRDH